jgi:hypothetical protein
MLPFLYEKFTIQTTLRIQEIELKLGDVIEPKQFFRALREWKPGQKPYEGKVEQDTFCAYPTTDYRKSFVPSIKGKITQEMGGCSIAITMRPNIALLLFMALWVGSIGFVFLSALWRLLETLLQTGFREVPQFLQLMVSGGMLIFGYGLLSGSYKKEAANSKSFFRKLLDENYIEEEDAVELFDED